MIWSIYYHQKTWQKQNRNISVKSVNMANIPFNVKIVRDLVYVFMKNKKAPVKNVVVLISVSINESRIIVKNAMDPAFVTTINVGLAVKSVKVEAFVLMENWKVDVFIVMDMNYVSIRYVEKYA